MATNYWTNTTGTSNWATPGNWSLGSPPVNTNDVYILQGNCDITSGLNQSTITLNSLTIGSGFTGTIGTEADTGSYLQIGTNTVQFPLAVGNGGFISGGTTRCKLDFGSVAYVMVCQSSGSSADTGRSAIQIKGGTNTSTAYVTGGSVDFAVKPGETGTLLSLSVGGTASVTTGQGMTCPTITQAGSTSTLVTYAAVTTLNQYSGTTYTFGSGAITTLYVNGSAFIQNRATGDSIGTMTIDSNGIADFSGDPRTTLFTNNPILIEGATLTAFAKDQLKKTGPASLALTLSNCGIGDVNLNLGSGLTLTVA